VRVQTKKRGTSQTKTIAAARLDEMHDSGEDLSAHLDLAKATRPGREIQRVNVDFPVDLLRAIDREAKRIGVTRQALIKLRLADTLVSH
jgi:D-serine deaminase-like pyridoxal phosphate-dependent protein